MTRRWRSALRRDGNGMVFMWACGEKDYGDDGECPPVYVNKPKEN